MPTHPRQPSQSRPRRLTPGGRARRDPRRLNRWPSRRVLQLAARATTASAKSGVLLRQPVTTVHLDEPVVGRHVRRGPLGRRWPQERVPPAPQIRGRNPDVPAGLGRRGEEQRPVVIDGPAQALGIGEAFRVVIGSRLAQPRPRQPRPQRRRGDSLRHPRQLERQHVPAAQPLQAVGERPLHRRRVRGGHGGEARHAVRMPDRDSPSDPAAPVVTDQVRPLKPRSVQQPDRVAGQLVDGVRASFARSGAGGVAPQVGSEGAQPTLVQPWHDRVPRVGVLWEPVQQDDGRTIGRARVEHVERQPSMNVAPHAREPRRSREATGHPKGLRPVPAAEQDGVDE